ncbi:Ornithine carbamoyltransferase [[Actinomadura] parvosata subsp. kistnae]|uniref:ornithine carbamoyltransferase n=1 Tax=[Actinomadura] parvosata TaxID=1955412 RepID=UPI0009ABB8F0|nr:ornithine carbamoyltransferase [Nonomuraea sp. ATCC 55076]SPL98770.1 Ornithine carbamoyltransferase [Actinomadura parvosata subsp. kistnae]
MKDLLRIADLTEHDLAYLLDRAEHLKRHPGAAGDPLDGQTVLLYFAKPSTRTRVSTETAVVRLGGVPLTVGPAELQLGRGETIADTARVISSYAAAVVIRTFDHDDVAQFARSAEVPVINALTDSHHPLQALADLLTLREHFGDPRGRRLAYVGPATNVTHSLMEATALAGISLAVATPDAYRPDPQVEAMARKISTGGELLITEDPYEAVRDADAVYTDVWLSMGDPQQEKAARIAALTPYRVTPGLMAAAASGAIFLHCLPAHRGGEVAAEVIDGPASQVFLQAANRLPTAQAVLEALFGRTLAGAR